MIAPNRSEFTRDFSPNSPDLQGNPDAGRAVSRRGCGVCLLRTYFETRSLESWVPIALNTEAVCEAEVIM